jgi:hypothetical protein
MRTGKGGAIGDFTLCLSLTELLPWIMDKSVVVIVLKSGKMYCVPLHWEVTFDVHITGVAVPAHAEQELLPGVAVQQLADIRLAVGDNFRVTY